MATETVTPEDISLTEIGQVVQRLQRKSVVMSPGKYRAASTVGILLAILGFCMMVSMFLVLQGISLEEADKTGKVDIRDMAMVVGVFLGLLMMAALMVVGVKLAARIPRSRISSDEWERAESRYGPYKTSDVLVMAYYAHQCAAEARDTEGRRRRRLIRMCTQYLYCPAPLRWAAALLPWQVEQAQSSTVRIESLLFYRGVYGGGNLVADTWDHLYYFAHTVSDALIGDLEHLTKLWCQGVYQVFRKERGELSLSTAADPYFVQARAELQRLLLCRPGPVKRNGVLAYREWIVAGIVIVVAWVMVTLIACFWRAALPATLVTAVLGSGGLILAAWNLYSGRIRAERAVPPTPSESAPNDVQH